MYPHGPQNKLHIRLYLASGHLSPPSPPTSPQNSPLRAAVMWTAQAFPNEVHSLPAVVPHPTVSVSLCIFDCVSLYISTSLSFSSCVCRSASLPERLSPFLCLTCFYSSLKTQFIHTSYLLLGLTLPHSHTFWRDWKLFNCSIPGPVFSVGSLVHHCQLSELMEAVDNVILFYTLCLFRGSGTYLFLKGVYFLEEEINCDLPWLVTS